MSFARPPSHHPYGAGQILVVLPVVLSSITSLRGAARAFETLTELMALPLPLLPCSWWAGRLWRLRLGVYTRPRPKPHADEWAGLPSIRCNVARKRAC